MIQPSLFDAPVRRTDPPTSQAAAARINVPGSWESVGALLARLGIASSEELAAEAARLGMKISESRIRGALAPKEMLGDGLIEIVDDGAVTKCGNRAQRYTLTPRGLSLWS